MWGGGWIDLKTGYLWVAGSDYKDDSLDEGEGC